MAECNDKITFDEAVESMNLSFEDAVGLQKALNDVTLERFNLNDRQQCNLC
jgi:hypothetical protein